MAHPEVSAGQGPEATPQQTTIHEHLLRIRDNLLPGDDTPGCKTVVAEIEAGEVVVDLRIGAFDNPGDSTESIFFHVDDEWLRAEADGSLSRFDQETSHFMVVESSNDVKAYGLLLERLAS